jgi:hypothetical protein
MRWATYNRLMDRLVAADGVADERLVPAAKAWAIMDGGTVAREIGPVQAGGSALM